ncbi:MAG: type II secretion system major pseudopilin GspG [Planctomycetaceae bacterium]|jgi:general secretion pathway protein G|nr:type II secretion system major pseudopilin GspG [Planctomycetaceae bacterium]
MQLHTAHRSSAETMMIRYRLGASRGFTLIEVLTVIFILLVLASAAVVAYRGTQEKANIDSTVLYVKNLSSALEMYQAHVGRFPTTEQGLSALLNPPSDLSNPARWSGPYLKDSAAAVDPWGNPYQYVCPGTRTRDGYDIWSFGPDGNDNTDDDIGNWTK